MTTPSDEVAPPTTMTLRLPSWLAEMIRDAADEQDRSMNWWIVRRLSDVFSEAAEAESMGWPDRQDGSCGALFTATLTWNMPYFDDGGDNDTELRIEQALSDACATLHSFGAIGTVDVTNIHAIGGSMLPTRIRRHPKGHLDITNSKAERREVADETVVETVCTMCYHGRSKCECGGLTG